MASFARLLMVLVGLLASADLGHAKVFERCELANELRSRGVSEKQLADWVCLAYHESRYDTAAVGRLNWDQSVDHGLFQISDIYWCDWSSDEPDRQYKNVCNNNCNSFRDDDIGDDLTCVMKIHKEHQRLQGNGFLAWVAWKQHCQHSDLSSYVSGCDRVTTSTTQRPTTTTTTTTRRPTATGRPSVQDFYRNPSKTNAHTHFNNLAPLANLLVRGARPQKAGTRRSSLRVHRTSPSEVSCSEVPPALQRRLPPAARRPQPTAHRPRPPAALDARPVTGPGASCVPTGREPERNGGDAVRTSRD